MISMDELLTLTGGFGRASFAITASTPEERRRIETEILILQGRFQNLPPAQQEKCLWRQHVLAYWLLTSRKHRSLSNAAIDSHVGAVTKCNFATIRRWRHATFDLGADVGYWHLYLQPKTQIRGAGAGTDVKALQIAFDGLHAGLRPSEIANSIRQAGLKMGVRAIHRLRQQEEAEGRLIHKRFKNRFE